MTTSKEEELEQELVVEQQVGKYSAIICWLFVGILIGAVGTITISHLSQNIFPEPIKEQKQPYIEFYKGDLHYLIIGSTIINYTSDSLEYEAIIGSPEVDSFAISHSELTWDSLTKCLPAR